MIEEMKLAYELGYKDGEADMREKAMLHARLSALIGASTEHELAHNQACDEIYENLKNKTGEETMCLNKS
jgi:hypothetical protein